MKIFSPALFRPSTTLLIDDDAFFINDVCSLLPSDTNPKVVTQEMMDSLCDKDIFYASGKSAEDSNLSSTRAINSLFYSPSDLVVSTIVIDQYMAPKLGLEILANFKSPFVQKILISNMLVNDEAIQALNEGVINFYLRKSPSFVNDLTKLIYDAQNRFFCNLSLALSNFLASDNPLIEGKVRKIIQQIKDDFKMPYYCSNHNLRRFSFTDNLSEKKLNLQILPQQELEEFLSSHQAESAPPEILNLIKKGQMLPCFEQDFIPDGEHWSDYLQPAQNFLGKQKYYYSIYSGQKNDDI